MTHALHDFSLIFFGFMVAVVLTDPIGTWQDKLAKK